MEFYKILWKNLHKKLELWNFIMLSEIHRIFILLLKKLALKIFTLIFKIFIREFNFFQQKKSIFYSFKYQMIENFQIIQQICVFQVKRKESIKPSLTDCSTNISSIFIAETEIWQKKDHKIETLKIFCMSFYSTYGQCSQFHVINRIIITQILILLFLG